MYRYYVGAKHIGAAVGRNQNSPTQRNTMADAILDAETAIDNGEADTLVVVKIVAVVRRVRRPTTTEILED